MKSCTQGEIDLAIVALPVPAKYLEVEELFEEELLLVLPPGHPLGRQIQNSPERCRAVPVRVARRSTLSVGQHCFVLSPAIVPARGGGTNEPVDDGAGIGVAITRCFDDPRDGSASRPKRSPSLSIAVASQADADDRSCLEPLSISKSVVKSFSRTSTPIVAEIVRLLLVPRRRSARCESCR